MAGEGGLSENAAAVEKTMPIDATEFGAIIVDGKTYERDVIIRLSGKPEASAYFAKKDCRFVLQRTPDAILTFNRSRDRKIALMHVTC